MPMNIWGKIGRRMRHKDAGKKSKLSQDLLHFRKSVDYGFPHKTTAVAFDPKLKLLAIGTKTGCIKVFGAPGVELSVKSDSNSTITHLYFLKDQGRFISIEDSVRLRLWEINERRGVSILECVKSINLEESHSSRVSVCCVSLNQDVLLIGTEGGKVFQLDVPTFALNDHCLLQDELTKELSNDYRLSPGAVEAIAHHPTNNDQILIGYNKGLIILWDRTASDAVNAFHAGQELDSIDWHIDGSQFISAHSDGSYIIWNATANQENINEPIKPPERATTPYGPFPCKAINKILWKSSEDEPYIILSGGMPRASYGEKHTVSVIQDSEQVVFDISSRIIDFFTIDEADGERDIPHSLVILAEEEIIAIDLSSDGWPTHQLPYIPSMHSSAFTCAQHVSDVPDQLWEKIVTAGTETAKNSAMREWPINGGPQKAGTCSNSQDLLLTGHEDGTVRFWDASKPYTRLMYKLSTAHVFEHEDASNEQDCEDEWPPFRKVGTFDPYSDDPRLGVQKISLCTDSETLIVGGSAGQVVILDFNTESRAFTPDHVVCNIVNDRDNFEWKGHEALRLQPGENDFKAGFQPACVMQMYPPAGCTALSVHSAWNLLSAGTAHGFTIFDFKNKKEVSSTCTLNAQEHMGEGNMSRTAKFKQSLRDSVRRVRRTRTMRGRESPKKSVSAPVITPRDGEDGAASTPSDGSPRKSPATTPSHEKPIERKIEARSNDDSNNSVVRTLVFADTFILDGTVTSPSLWAGTNGGYIYIYKITISNQVKSDLCKEIKLRHRAPVISIVVLDRDGVPLHEKSGSEAASSPDHNTHSVLITSEEQIKVFSLPLLKAKQKVKITAYDGSRLRKVGLVLIRSRTVEDYLSYGLIALSNLGEISLYNVPQLGLQCKYACIRRDDAHGISTCLFTKYAEGFYLSSPSEYARFSLTAWQCVNADCLIELPEGARPKAPEPAPEAEVEAPPQPEAELESPDTPSKENGDNGSDDLKLSPEEPEGNITVDSVKEYMSPPSNEEPPEDGSSEQ